MAKPILRQSLLFLLNLYDYFLIFLRGSGLDYGTDCFCDPALLANDLAHIGRSYLKFDQCVVTLSVIH